MKAMATCMVVCVGGPGSLVDGGKVVIPTCLVYFCILDIDMHAAVSVFEFEYKANLH